MFDALMSTNIVKGTHCRSLPAWTVTPSTNAAGVGGAVSTSPHLIPWAETGSRIGRSRTANCLSGSFNLDR